MKPKLLYLSDFWSNSKLFCYSDFPSYVFMKIFLKIHENKKIVFKTTQSLFLKLIKNILCVYKNGK